MDSLPFLHNLANVVAAEVTASIPNDIRRAADRAALLTDVNAGRDHIMLYFVVKLVHLQHAPHIVFGLGSHYKDRW